MKEISIEKPCFEGVTGCACRRCTDNFSELGGDATCRVCELCDAGNMKRNPGDCDNGISLTPTVASLEDGGEILFRDDKVDALPLRKQVKMMSFMEKRPPTINLRGGSNDGKCSWKSNTKV